MPTWYLPLALLIMALAPIIIGTLVVRHVIGDEDGDDPSIGERLGCVRPAVQSHAWLRAGQRLRDRMPSVPRAGQRSAADPWQG